LSIITKNLSYCYSNSEKEVIRNINLEVRRGEFILLVGRSGCGKTTLARCLNGLIPHVYGGVVKGQVLVNGLNVADTPVYEMAKQVGMVFQNPDTQLCTLTVEEEVAFGSENLGIAREEIRRRVEWVLSSLEMEKLRHRATFSLSEGEKQRVALASALSMLPSVLILDEPAANLDPSASILLVDILQKIREQYNTTIMLIEHRVERFAEAADRIIVMASGEIVEDGSREIITQKSDLLENLSVQPPEIVEIGKALKISPSNGDLNCLRDQALQKLLELRETVPPYRFNRGQKEILIEFKNVFYRYGNGFALTVDKLKLYRGEIVAVVGNNGSGKTTLAKLVVGLIKQKRGHIERAPGIKGGMVFQNFEVQLFNNSVFNEVAFQIRTRRKKAGSEEIKMRVNEILDLMNLNKLASRHPHSLSQGEKQRVAVASLLAEEPDILILDEPTTGQDGYHLKKLLETVIKLRDRGITVLLITHNLRFAAKCADRVIVLQNGKTICIENARDSFYKIEEYTGFEPPETVKLAKKAGLKNLVTPEDVKALFESQNKNPTPTT